MMRDYISDEDIAHFSLVEPSQTQSLHFMRRDIVFDMDLIEGDHENNNVGLFVWRSRSP